MPLKPNNKKILILLGILVLVLVLLSAVIFLLKDQEDKKMTLTPEQQAQLQEVIDANPYLQEDPVMVNKKIKVEMATDQEMAAMGIIPKTLDGREFRIQVIERDSDGKILSYKVVYSDTDIAEEITVPEVGYFTNGGVIPFAE